MTGPCDIGKEIHDCSLTSKTTSSSFTNQGHSCIGDAGLVIGETDVHISVRESSDTLYHSLMLSYYLKCCRSDCSISFSNISGSLLHSWTISWKWNKSALICKVGSPVPPTLQNVHSIKVSLKRLPLNLTFIFCIRLVPTILSYIYLNIYIYI